MVRAHQMSTNLISSASFSAAQLPSYDSLRFCLAVFRQPHTGRHFDVLVQSPRPIRGPPYLWHMTDSHQLYSFDRELQVTPWSLGAVLTNIVSLTDMLNSSDRKTMQLHPNTQQ
ncbi:hypothetical protein F2P81_005556 [Scophthalmus maximus]|uniref:Uncharacterized protein n=1 Tax=Scophthalmus maximus TaxID=52904 RepID=A0A6A4TFM8_SCOMX|nr:hypothetical protein F2P81_005556 [Scophthalmus maximus]